MIHSPRGYHSEAVHSPWGPYEPDPTNPILTSLAEPFEGRGDDDFLKPHLFNPEIAIQKPGHASIVQTEAGEWYMAHLGARPLLPSRRCVLERETFLQRCSWTADGWLRVEDPGRRPRDIALFSCIAMSLQGTSNCGELMLHHTISLAFDSSGTPYLVAYFVEIAPDG